MVTTGFSKDDCIKNLRSFYEEIDTIFRLFDGKNYILREKIQLARELLKSLKSDLKRDYNQRTGNNAYALMSDVERSYYFPAIHEAWAGIHVATNSTPSSKWLQELGAAQSTISYYLYQMED